MVTGSHNPPNYNGFKMMLKNKPFFGAQIQDLGARAAAGQVVPETTGSVVAEGHLGRLCRAPAQGLGRRRET